MTLVELVIGMSILLLVYSFVLPKFDSSKYEVVQFSKQLCSDIRYVRKKNMLSDFSTYIMYTEDGYRLRSEGEDVRINTLPKDVQIEHEYSKIKFRVDGSPDPLGTTINIFSKDINKEITIVPISGRVLLKEGIYE